VLYSATLGPTKVTIMSLQRQVAAKMSSKRDPQQEEEVMNWIEAVMGETVFPKRSAFVYEETLKDGQVLCRLINKLAPGSVAKINSSGGQFKMMENIQNFQKAIQKYGVPEIDLFQTVDLYEKKAIATVTSTIEKLGSATWKHPEYTGARIGAKPAEENVREFSEETIAAGKTAIGLQAGQNQGASQAGQNMGAGRKIIIGK